MWAENITFLPLPFKIILNALLKIYVFCTQTTRGLFREDMNFSECEATVSIQHTVVKEYERRTCCTKCGELLDWPYNVAIAESNSGQESKRWRHAWPAVAIRNWTANYKNKNFFPPRVLGFIPNESKNGSQYVEGKSISKINSRKLIVADKWWNNKHVYKLKHKSLTYTDKLFERQFFPPVTVCFFENQHQDRKSGFLKFVLEQAMKVQRRSRGILWSTLSLTSALDGGGWLTTRPGRFFPGKETRYPFYRRMCGVQGIFIAKGKTKCPVCVTLYTVHNSSINFQHFSLG